MNAAPSRDANLPFEHWMKRAALFQCDEKEGRASVSVFGRTKPKERFQYQFLASVWLCRSSSTRTAAAPGSGYESAPEKELEEWGRRTRALVDKLQNELNLTPAGPGAGQTNMTRRIITR
jgi:hypothetical protein